MRIVVVSDLHVGSESGAGTSAALVAASRSAWAGMGEGDLFVLYVSGHGGRLGRLVEVADALTAAGAEYRIRVSAGIDGGSRLG